MTASSPPWPSSRRAGTWSRRSSCCAPIAPHLPRLAVTEPLDTAQMCIHRRISATYKDLPGGQVLGPTFDYTHRLLDFGLADPDSTPASTETAAPEGVEDDVPRVIDILNHEGLIEEELPDDPELPVGDLTRAPLDFPADRDVRLQNLARGDEGFLLALGYSTQRGFGSTHPFAGEIRLGEVAVEIVPEELGFAIDIGDIQVTECQMINQFKGSADEAAKFTRGYGLTFGTASARRCPWPWSIGRCGPASSVNRPTSRPATRNSSSITPTTWRPRGSCSISSCRTTSISKANWERSAICAPKPCAESRGRTTRDVAGSAPGGL